MTSTACRFITEDESGALPVDLRTADGIFQCTHRATVGQRLLVGGVR